jgi:hypothetical protein
MHRSTVEVGYNVMKRSEYFVSLQTSVVITEKCNAMVKSDELLPQNNWRYRRGVALTDVVITRFECVLKLAIGYTQQPPTRFGQTCGYLQGGKIQRMNT